MENCDNRDIRIPLELRDTGGELISASEVSELMVRVWTQDPLRYLTFTDAEVVSEGGKEYIGACAAEMGALASGVIVYSYEFHTGDDTCRLVKGRKITSLYWSNNQNCTHGSGAAATVGMVERVREELKGKLPGMVKTEVEQAVKDLPQGGVDPSEIERLEGLINGKASSETVNTLSGEVAAAKETAEGAQQAAQAADSKAQAAAETAGTALATASEAASAATAAGQTASDAKSAASDAYGIAGNAMAAAQAAQSTASAALSAAQEAKGTAEAANENAKGAQSAATKAAEDAASAKTAADAAKTEVESAKAAAGDALVKLEDLSGEVDQVAYKELLIKMWEGAAGSDGGFNREKNAFWLYDIDDIDEDEAIMILRLSTIPTGVQWKFNFKVTPRVLLPFNAAIYTPYNFNKLFYDCDNSKLEVVSFSTGENKIGMEVSNLYQAFRQCPRLKSIHGILYVAACKSMDAV